MSGKVKTFPTSPVDPKAKYEVADVEDGDRFDPKPPKKSKPIRRGSTEGFASYQDSPSLAKQRRKSIGGPAPSPRNARFADSSGASGTRSRSDSRDGTRSGDNSLDASAFAHLADRGSFVASPKVGTPKSALTPTSSRRASKGGKRKVTFRNPVADIIFSDNSLAVSQLEGQDYSMLGDDHSGSGNNSKFMKQMKRRRRRQSTGFCCTVS